jgi:hypothetical protein
MSFSRTLLSRVAQTAVGCAGGASLLSSAAAPVSSPPALCSSSAAPAPAEEASATAAASASTTSEIVRQITKSTGVDELTEYLTASPSLLSVFAICFPNSYMLYMHSRGATGTLVNFTLRNFGVYGLFVIPFIGIAMEKSFYDTAMCIQYVLFFYFFD